MYVININVIYFASLLQTFNVCPLCFDDHFTLTSVFLRSRWVFFSTVFFSLPPFFALSLDMSVYFSLSPLEAW